MFYLQQSIGIEFREQSLKVVHLGKTLSGFKLLNWLQASLPAGDISAPEYREAAISQLKEFIQQHKIKLDEAIIGLPPGEVALRQIELPAAEPEELSQMLEYEMERHLPFISHEVYLDFLITGKGEQFQSLLLLAARKDRVDQYLELLSQAGLKCAAVDINLLAVINLLRVNGLTANGGDGSAPGDYLLVGVEAEAVELGLIRSGKLVLARCCSLAELGLLGSPSPPTSQVETRSESTPRNPEDQAGEIAQKIAREMGCWQKSLGCNPEEPWLEHIFVLTGGERGELIRRKLEEQTRIPASIPDTWPVIKYNLDGGSEAVGLAVGMGLALRGVADCPQAINLLPPLLRQPPKKGGLVVTMGLIVLVALLGIANLASFFLKDRLALARVRQQMELLKPRLAAINDLEDRYKRLQLQVGTLSRLKPKSVTILDILKEITLRLPADAWLEKMKVENNTVEISGWATAASNLIPLLEESSLFENVRFTSAITSREGGKEKFKIRLTLERAADEETG
jgi:type IV pilus assembly protein PilM